MATGSKKNVVGFDFKQLVSLCHTNGPRIPKSMGVEITGGGLCRAFSSANLPGNPLSTNRSGLQGKTLYNLGWLWSVVECRLWRFQVSFPTKSLATLSWDQRIHCICRKLQSKLHGYTKSTCHRGSYHGFSHGTHVIHLLENESTTSTTTYTVLVWWSWVVYQSFPSFWFTGAWDRSIVLPYFSTITFICM